MSCAAFKCFSTFLEWCLRECSGVATTVHYLDDLLFAGPVGYGQCQFLFSSFCELIAELGVSVAEEKTVGPVQVLTLLGIELHTVHATSRPSDTKLRELCAQLDECSNRRKMTFWELQSLIGHLNFACKMIPPGWAFLQHLCDAMKAASCPHHRIKGSSGMRLDLEVWKRFLGKFNGVSFWREEAKLEAELRLHSDVAGASGFGVFYNKHWCAKDWPQNWVEKGWTRDLTFLDFFPILVVVWLWDDELANHTVHFWLWYT